MRPNGLASLHGLNLVSDDLEALITFYRELGVDIPDESVWRTDTGIHHVTPTAGSDVDVDFDSPALAAVYASRMADAAGATVITLTVGSREAVDETHDRMVDTGHASLHAPWDAFWGARFAMVADPDGRPVGLVSPVDPNRRGEPPSL